MSQVKIPCQFVKSAMAVPKRVVGEVELQELLPNEDIRRYTQKTGIKTRRWCSESETSATLAADCLTGLFENCRFPRSSMTKAIFCSSTGGVVSGPATSNLVLKHLGWGMHPHCFDINNACTGFLTSIEIAGNSLFSSDREVTAVVAAEEFSRFIDPTDPRTFAIFGDGAAALLVAKSDNGAGIVASNFANAPELFDYIQVSNWRTTLEPKYLKFSANAREVSELVFERLSETIRLSLDEARLGIRDIDWFVIHQPNSVLLEQFMKSMEICPSRTVNVVDELGSLGAASTAIVLHKVLEKAGSNQNILLAAIGGGVSWGSMIYKTGE